MTLRMLLPIRQLLGGAAALAFLACGSAGPTVASADAPEGDGPAAAAPGEDEEGRRKLSEDDFTVHRVEDVKEPVYLEEIDRGAQDSFREGVEIIASAKPDYTSAVAKFKTATEQDPTFLEAFFNWGMVLERTGRGDEALTIYQAAMDKNPGDPSARAYIAKIYLAKARNAQNYGKTTEANSWLSKSKTLLDELLASNPTNVAVNNAMALYYLSGDDLDTAERYVKEVLYVEPSNITGLNTRGLINLKRGKFLIARWIFENKVLREDPTSTEALTNLGYTYIKLEQRPLAMQFFQKALAADPENMAVRMNIASMLLEHLDYAGAMDHYDKVLAAQPTNTEAKIGRCDAMFGLGGAASDKKAQFLAAIDCYNAYLKDDPSRSDLYARMADTHQNKLQDFEGAVKYFELYGKHAKLSAEDAEKNGKIIKTLKDIIASGGLKATEGFDDPNGGFDDPDGGFDDFAPEGGDTAPAGGGEAAPEGGEGAKAAPTGDAAAPAVAPAPASGDADASGSGDGKAE